jgi:hypothetical protein
MSAQRLNRVDFDVDVANLLFARARETKHVSKARACRTAPDVVGPGTADYGSTAAASMTRQASSATPSDDVDAPSVSSGLSRLAIVT